MSTLIATANAIASIAHTGQVRKYTGEPYINHPEAVAAIVRRAGGTTDMIAAAILHDVVEDTAFTFVDVENFCGPYVAQLVRELTDVSTPSDGPRAVRKEMDLQHLAEASPEAQSIKLADLIDNTKSIVEHDPKFAKVYLREKQRLLGVLLEGDHELWVAANTILRKSMRELGMI